MIVGLLTIEQKNQIDGQYYAEDKRFTPVQDKDGDWIIFIQEMYGCINPDFMWVRTLPTIEWVSPISE